MKKTNLSAALEARKKELETELIKINTIQEQGIINQHYPLFKKKYEGKYFKRSNGYNDKERWWMYTKVVEIKPDDVYDTKGNGVASHYTGWTFQTASNDEITISKEERGYVQSLGYQISKAEFTAAWNKMIDKLNAME